MISSHKQRTSKDRDRIIEGRRELAKFADSYLKKTQAIIPNKDAKSRVEEQIKLLKEAEPENVILLMSAHQPNLFPYSGVLRKIALLEAIKRRIKKLNGPRTQIVSFFGISDRDLVNNRWIRSAEMPAPLRKEGVLRLSINFNEKDKQLPSREVPQPKKQAIDLWKSQLLGCISENSILATKYARANNFGSGNLDFAKNSKQNFEEFWKHVEQVHEKTTSLAEFNSQLLAIVAHQIWQSPVPFVYFSDCFTTFGMEYKFLLENSKEYSETLKKTEAKFTKDGINTGITPDIADLLPFWFKCTNCGSRYRVKHAGHGGATGQCVHCGKEFEYDKEELEQFVNKSPELIEPRSISMPICFSRAMDVACYISGIGGLGYITHTKLISEKLKSPLPTITFWYVPDKYVSVQTLAASLEVQKITELYNLGPLDLAPQKIIEASQTALIRLNKKLKAGLVSKTSVSERSKQVLESIPRSLHINACTIDYAVNIGLKQTYDQWNRYLDEDGRLHEPVPLRSIIA